MLQLWVCTVTVGVTRSAMLGRRTVTAANFSTSASAGTGGQTSSCEAPSPAKARTVFGVCPLHPPDTFRQHPLSQRSLI